VFDNAHKWRYIDLFPNRDEAFNTPTQVRGVIGSLPGIIGSIQATEVIKLITRLGEPLIGKLFTIDIRTMESHTMRLK
jgi:adenylyltransferase/sulfurtransferase